MKKLTVLIGAAMFLAMPMIAAAAGGIQGDCYGCHTMHNSEGGNAVAQVGTAGTVTTTPLSNLLKYDCLACHAMDPAGSESIVTLPGGSQVPQVAHAGTDLAGGNFSYGLSLGAAPDGSNVHNVNDLFAGQWDNNTGWNNEPPGIYHSEDRGAFTTTDPFDNFTCAGARGCHGTRLQVLTATDNGTALLDPVLRTGMAAITGAHHLNADGLKTGDAYSVAESHDPVKVAGGYRFLPGTWGFGNLQDRWENVDENSHNEYQAIAGGFGSSSCGTCHIGATGNRVNSRLGYDSTIKVPNAGMSAFCGTCHSSFHSSGTDNESIRGNYGGDPDTFGNGVSGAFLRHPSDYVIPASYDYAGNWNVTAPVGRPDLAAFGAGLDENGSPLVTETTDMVMCLSCHVAHGSANDYLLRFDYSTMTAGGYTDLATAQAAGGCLTCHGAKGVAK